MPMYPAIYVCLTLPLATARMIAFAGGHPSDTVLAIAGACLASCGAADAVVYGLTRDVFADSDWLPPSLWRRFKVYVRCNRRTSRDAVPAVESVRRRRGHRSLASRVLDEEAQEGGVGLDAVDVSHVTFSDLAAPSHSRIMRLTPCRRPYAQAPPAGSPGRCDPCRGAPIPAR